MANLLMALATLAIMGVLITFGAYQGYYTVKRSEYSDRINGSVSRLNVYVRQLNDDLGRYAGAADVPVEKTAMEALNGPTPVAYTVGNTGTYSWVCARASSAQGWMVEAMQRVKDNYSSAVMGDACDTSTGAGAANVSVTLRIN